MAEKEKKNKLNKDSESEGQRKTTGKEVYDLYYVNQEKNIIKFLAIILGASILLFILIKFLLIPVFPDNDFFKKAAGIFFILPFATIIAIIYLAVSLSMWKTKLKVDKKQAVKLEDLKKEVQVKEDYSSKEDINKDNNKYKETLHSYQIKVLIYYFIIFLVRIVEETIKDKGIIRNLDIKIQNIIYIILYLIMAIFFIIGTIYLIKIFVFMAKENKKIKDEKRKLKEEEKRLNEEKQKIENKIEKNK